MRTVEAAGLSIGDGAPPRVMGVLNVSVESPYDPSVYADPGAAAEYVDEELIGEGADIVDVGLESANKRFEVLSAEEELDRLDTAVETVESTSGDAVFSIETRYAEVAEAALDRGFDMVNDICGFADPAMPELCREREVVVAKMASPPDLQRPGAIEDVDEIYDALADDLTDRTIVDPAFGGWSDEKTLADDRETFDRLREFSALARPVLVSINRKNFLRDLVGRSTERALPASLAATAMAVERGADVVRTHDVAETVDAAVIGHELARDLVRRPAEGVVELDVTTPREARRHLDRIGATEGDGDADDRADPDRAATRAFELVLPAADREAVATAAAEAGATLATDAPTGGDRTGGDRDGTAILYGTVRALDRTAELLASEGQAEAVAAAVRDAS